MQNNMTTPNDNEVSQALDVIKEFCFAHQLGVAVAESVSAGYLQSFFSSEAKAGLFFEGGMTTYNCQQKQRFLDIPFEICDPCNGVDEEISRRMALKICDLFECSIGLSLTGYASPIPEQGIFDLYAFGAIALHGKVVYCQKIISDKDAADGIRKDYAKILITACAKILDLQRQTKDI
jgi:PncC family amidohydrolase